MSLIAEITINKLNVLLGYSIRSWSRWIEDADW